MMPDIIEWSFDIVKPADLSRMIYVAMLRIVEWCFARMDCEQRRNLIALCRRILERVSLAYSVAPPLDAFRGTEIL